MNNGLPRVVASISLLGLSIFFLGAVALGEEEAHSESTSLDRQWETLMLEGKSLVLINDTQLRSSGTPYQTYEGKVDHVWSSDRGIRLDDLRESSLGGLLTKGGWRLEGGLLYAAAHTSGGTVELYGKSRWRIEPALFHFALTFHSGMSPPRSARHSYEFFLLYRPEGGATAKLLAKWTVPSEKVLYDHYLRGHLTYDPKSANARVTVTDINDKKTILAEDINAEVKPATRNIHPADQANSSFPLADLK